MTDSTVDVVKPRFLSHIHLLGLQNKQGLKRTLLYDRSTVDVVKPRFLHTFIYWESKQTRFKKNAIV